MFCRLASGQPMAKGVRGFFLRQTTIINHHLLPLLNVCLVVIFVVNFNIVRDGTATSRAHASIQFSSSNVRLNQFLLHFRQNRAFFSNEDAIKTLQLSVKYIRLVQKTTGNLFSWLCSYEFSLFIEKKEKQCMEKLDENSA